MDIWLYRSEGSRMRRFRYGVIYSVAVEADVTNRAGAAEIVKMLEYCKPANEKRFDPVNNREIIAKFWMYTTAFSTFVMIIRNKSFGIKRNSDVWHVSLHYFKIYYKWTTRKLSLENQRDAIRKTVSKVTRQFSSQKKLLQKDHVDFSSPIPNPIQDIILGERDLIVLG